MKTTRRQSILTTAHPNAMAFATAGTRAQGRSSAEANTNAQEAHIYFYRL
jgi:hypothetical protein